MMAPSRPLTLDSSVLIAALKKDESESDRCAELLRRVPNEFLLSEPSILYAEVCGTLARTAGVAVANDARVRLDSIIIADRVDQCDKSFCLSAYSLCQKFDLYAIDALYLKTALDHHAMLVSLGEEDFIVRVKANSAGIEVYLRPNCHTRGIFDSSCSS